MKKRMAVPTAPDVVIIADPDLGTRDLAAIERDVIRAALLREPTTSAAARALGIGRSTLYRKLAEYQL